MSFSSPPAIRPYPFSRPQTPPETPQSTKRMPFFARNSACTASSVNRELPPSMTRSPLDSTPASAWMTSSVIFPDGTITQTTRGSGSASASASRVGTSVTAGFGS